MTRIALFRYHNNVEGCINRLSFFRHIHPQIPVYGLYGGPEELFFEFEEALSQFLSGNYCIKTHDSLWKWKNGDLAIAEWFRDKGHALSFDMVHLLEWDLLFFSHFDLLYANVPADGIGFAGTVALPEVADKWFWVRNEKQRKEWEQLKVFLHEKWGFQGPYLASVAPGMCLSYSFLERYVQQPIPDWGNDELRLPNVARAMGVPVFNLGFYRKWFSKREWRYFNCNDMDISEKTIRKELKKSKGRRVFHPYRSMVDIKQLFLSENN